MPREETIQIKIDKISALRSISELKAEAESLKKAFGSIKVSDSVKAVADQAKAAQAVAKAEMAAANALNAKARAAKAASSATVAAQREEQAIFKTLQQESKAFKENEKAMAETSKRRKESANATKAEANAEAALERATKAKLQAQKEAQNVTNAQIRGGREAANLAKALASADKEVSNAEAAKSRAQKAAIQAQEAENKSLSKGAEIARSYGTAIMSTIKQLVGFTGVTQSLRYAFDEMKNMSDELVVYRKVTGATADEMERIRQSAYDTAKKYGQTPSDFLASASNMARAGYGDQSVAMAELATKTQLVGDMTADAASQFLLAVDAGYKYKGSIEQLSSVLDAANEIDNNYATSIAKLSEGMTLVASLAGSANVPIEQLMAALGTMTASTQRSGAEMARGLRSIMLNVMGDTSTEIEEGVTVTEENIESLTDALNKYAPEVVKAAKATGKLINPMEAIGALAKAYKDGLFTEQDLFGISKEVAGQRYYNAFSSLIQNYDMYESMLQSIGKSAGSADKEVGAMLDSWSTKWNQFKTTWTQVVNSTVDDGIIKFFLDAGRSALDFAGNLANLTGVIGGVYAAIKLLKAGNMGGGIFGFAVAGVSALKAIGENQFASSTKDAQNAAEASAKLVSSTQSLGEAIRKYQEIAADGVIDTGELATAKSLQEQIKTLVGETASNWDLVNGNVQQNIQLLGEAAREYAKTAYSKAKTNTANAGIAVMAAAENWEDQLTGAGFRYNRLPLSKTTKEIRQYIEKNFAGYSEYTGGPGAYPSFYDISMRGGMGIDELVKFYQASQGLQELFADTYSIDELSKIDFYKDLTGGLQKMQPAMDAYIQALKEEHNALANEILIEDDFISKQFDNQDALQAYVDSLAEAKGLNEEQKKSLMTMAQAMADVSEAAGTGAEGMNDAAVSANVLATAINNATKAKEKFDDAMKESKADAFNDYVKMAQTLEQEMSAGRVNSTAFHASARALLGDELYYSANGDTKQIQALLRQRGESGSAIDAQKILGGTYKDKSGNVVEGFGLYQLLSQTKGFDKSLLTDKDGNWQIPDLTPYMDMITSQWGNLAQDFVVAAWNALDQYDTEGKNTSSKLEETKKNVESQNTELADSAGEASASVEQLGDAASDAAQETEAAAEAAKGEETQPSGEAQTSSLQAQTDDAKSLVEALREVQSLYNSIGKFEGTPGADSTFAALIDQVNWLQTNGIIDIDVQNGAGTEEAVTATTGIVNALTLLQGMEDIDANVKANLQGDLYSKFEAIWPFLTDEQKQEVALYLNLNGDDEVTDKIKNIVNPTSGYEAEIEVGADTSSAEKSANAAVASINSKTATIKVQAVESGISLGNRTVTKDSIFKSGHGAGAPSKGGYVSINATGTRSHPGGLALVNDGTGPELIIDRGRAFVAGGGKPSIVNLQKGAKVFTASETRNIFSGSGVPAYEDGSTSIAPTSGNLGGISGSGKASDISLDGGGSGGNKKKKKTTNKKSSGKSSSSAATSNPQAYKDMQTMVNYIIDRVGDALDEQLEIIDAQIDELKAARDAAKQQNELEERQKAVAEAQKDLADALGERTVRYLGEDGKWHWMADARSVKSAQESLTKAQDSLREYEEDMAFNAQVEALENQKKTLQDEYNEITKTWQQIQDAVNTPTGDLSKLISDVLSGGTAQEKKGASTTQSLLLGSLLGGGSYKGNYSEALSAISKATAGSPVMPGEASATLASLIAMSGAGASGGSVTDALKTASNPITSGVVGGLNGMGGSQTNVNYFINGLQLGSDQADQPLSSIMKNLSVYTNTTVN